MTLIPRHVSVSATVTVVSCFIYFVSLAVRTCEGYLHRRGGQERQEQAQQHDMEGQNGLLGHCGPVSFVLATWFVSRFSLSSFLVSEQVTTTTKKRMAKREETKKSSGVCPR